MNQLEPLVSVCIPTYNRAKKLERAVKALLGGCYKNLEIIISDNASSDETQRVCVALSAFDSRVKYFRHAENRGATRNFEFARAQASGKYFLWHGDDDYLEPDYIRTCADELERDPSLVLASGLAAYHNGNNMLTHYGNVIQCYSNRPLFRVLKYLWLVSDNSIFCGAYRIDQVRDYKLPNCFAGDWAWMAVVLFSGKAKVVPSVRVHREFEDSTSSSIARMISVINAPSWQASLPSIAISGNVAGYLVARLNGFKSGPFARNLFIYLIVYSVLVIKGLMRNLHAVVAKVPFVKVIYRRYLKKNIL